MSLRIVFASSDQRILDSCLSEVIDVLRSNSIPFTGPIPLPTGMTRFNAPTVKISNNLHRRLIDLEVEKSPAVLEEFNIPIGVSVQMKQV